MARGRRVGIGSGSAQHLKGRDPVGLERRPVSNGVEVSGQVIQRSRVTGRKPLAQKCRMSTATAGTTRTVSLVVRVARLLAIDEAGELTERFKQVGDLHRAVPVGRFFQEQ